ncbi:MAG: hypothetical protein HGA36_00620 [Candidatus Moranbacteria bacterium]|nr:hypothetical protein [Candidatus Moranbacteria bacterium]
MKRPLTKSVATIERDQLIFFLEEIVLFLETYLPDLCKESLATEQIRDLKKTLQKSYPNFRLYYPTRLKSFALLVRNCVRKRCALVRNPELESTCIHIKQWPEIKKTLANKTQIELILIASKLINEAYEHLSDILLDLRCSEITALLNKN